METIDWSKMGLAQLIALAAALGFTSGIRLYALLFFVGLAGHFNWVHLPQAMSVLSHPVVLSVTGVLSLVEFLADKIPALDSVWDTIHTFIRLPVAATLVGSLGGDSTVNTSLLAILGGGIAATSHVAKSGTRLAINTSPEPVSNWGASLSEDALSLTLLWLIFTHPFIAGGIVLMLLIGSVWLIHHLWRFVCRLFVKVRVA